MKTKYLYPIIIVLIGYFFYSNKNVISFEKAPTKITLQFYGSSIESADQNVIKQVLAVVNSNEQIEDHKCSDIGGLTLSYNNHSVYLSLLPSHHNGYLEFRHKSKTYRISEPDFFSISIFETFHKKFTKEDHN